MLEALARGAFERDVGRLDQRVVERRNWTVVSTTFPVLDVIFNHPRWAPLRLRFTCDDWNDLPPAIELLAADGTPIPANTGPGHPLHYIFANGLFNASPHRFTHRPFVCMRGSREFHTHENHLGEAWDNYRGQSGNDLLGLLDQLWRVWKRAAP